MKKLFAILIAVVLAVVVAVSSFAAGFTDNAEEIENAAKSVLMLFVYENEYDELSDWYASGSGFVAFNNSTLVTNYHVIDSGARILALDDDNNAYEFDKVLCADKKYDIAILGFSEPTKLKPFDLYPNDHILRGSSVVVIGSPAGGNKNTVTKGIVSSQSNRYDDNRPEIQFSAQISHGSSGGVLLNDDGKVIGVATESSTLGEDLNYAVNISVAVAMYKAWDGKTYPVGSQPSIAKMDFTGVYEHNKATAAVTVETAMQVVTELANNDTWTCLNCGAENTTKFCQECGAEKPYWICSCGKLNSGNKFCGECGQSFSDQVDSLNRALAKAVDHDYADAAELLEGLGQFNSGSFETVEGTHLEAKSFIEKMYYDLGIYLQANNGSHEEILAAFIKAGDYGDVADQIAGENARYLKSFYDAGQEHLKNGKYDEAIEAFRSAGTYQDAASQILACYYEKGKKLLENKEYETCRAALAEAGSYEDAKNLILQSYYEEAEALLAERQYDKAIELFEKARTYSDAKDRIGWIYYTQAEEALDAGNTERAKELFGKAGGYKDSKDRIVQIEDSEKEAIYRAAVECFDNGKYQQAKELFLQVTGYKDAKEKITAAEFRTLVQEAESINDDTEKKSGHELKLILDLLAMFDKYKREAEAIELCQKLHYAYARHFESSAVSSAIEHYEMAGDYKDAPNRLLNCHKNIVRLYIDERKYDLAINYYKSKIKPITKEPYYVIQPGDKGHRVVNLLDLIKPLGIKTKSEIDRTKYKEEYVEYVHAIEEHFGFDGDGNISMEEFELIRDPIYQGVESNNVSLILGKLADLSYITNLPTEHTKYEAK